MGCSPSVNRNKQIDESRNIEDLTKIMEEYKKRCEEEQKGINEHLNNNKELAFEYLKSLNKENLLDRENYLKELGKAYGEIINTLSKSSCALPLSETKEHLQNCVRHFYVSYDKDNLFRKDIDEFIKFASPFEKNKK